MSDRDFASHPTRSGYHVRARALRALEAGTAYMSTTRTEYSDTQSTVQQDGPPSSSASSYDSTSTNGSSVRQLGRSLRDRSSTLLAYAGDALERLELSSDGADRPRRSMQDTLRLPRKPFSTYSPTYTGRGVNNDEYRRHNLFPLPPPGHVRPILLPTYAVHVAESDHTAGLHIRIDGFVEQWPSTVGTGQRIFMQLARQLANLPRLPRQQPAPYSRPGSQTPPVAKSHYTTAEHTTIVPPPSVSAPTTPLHADTDDSVFFPETPPGLPRREAHHIADDGGVFPDEGTADRLARHALALGTPERTLGRVLQGMGALPVEGYMDDRWQHQVHTAMEQLHDEQLDAQEHAPVAGPMGGSAFWANRTQDEVEKLWRTLEHRIRCFWTYRKPFQDVVIEVVPVFRSEKDDRPYERRWILDEYGVNLEDPCNDTPVLAVTEMRSDSHGLFTEMVAIPWAKLEHYLSHYYPNQKTFQDIVGLRMRARLQHDPYTNDPSSTHSSPWQTLHISQDSPQTVHVICDIDDTAKHTHVLGGARAVTRNVFARPFEEVTIPGVQSWFEHLRSEQKLVSGFHYVTNAPAEMHAIIKAYMATAKLPAGTLLLKHYFTSNKSSGVLSWLQAYMQPAAARKRQNLLRCLDDFPQTRFVLVGDSGEMDLEVYCELARQRPQQVGAIWIRDVGNVNRATKRLVEERSKRLDKQTSTPPECESTQQDPSYSSDEEADEYMVRMRRNLTLLPDSTTLHFWKTGYDAIEESVKRIQTMVS